MKDFILIAVLVAIVVGAGAYIYIAKRRGKACIGCPCSGECKGSCHLTVGEQDHNQTTK